MIEGLQRFFNTYLVSPTESDETKAPMRLNLAAAALLFEVARSDYDLGSEEQLLIESLVNQQFGLDKSSASALLELAESAAREATDLHGFTALINANWSLDEREKLVEWMWRVVYADGRLDDHEVHLMRKIQRLLYIPHRRFIATKLRHKPVDATTLDD